MKEHKEGGYEKNEEPTVAYECVCAVTDTKNTIFSIFINPTFYIHLFPILVIYAQSI